MSNNELVKQKITTLQDNLQKYEKTVASLLGSKYGITPQEFLVSVMNAAKNNTKLLECNPRSFYSAMLLSCELGLKPNTPDGHAYLIPYKGEVTFQVGYKGLIEIAYRSPTIKSFTGVAVYENEFYLENEDGTNVHIPYTGMDLNIMQLCKARKEFMQGLGISEDAIIDDLAEYKERLKKGKGELVLVYAKCIIDGLELPIWKSVTKDVLERIEKLSPGGASSFSPYKSGTDVHNSMRFKAAIKLLAKFLPKQSNPQLARAIEIDDKLGMGANTFVDEETGEVQIIEAEHTVVHELEDLQMLYDFKKESVPADEQIGIERILANKEIASYAKVHKYLKEL